MFAHAREITGSLASLINGTRVSRLAAARYRRHLDFRAYYNAHTGPRVENGAESFWRRSLMAGAPWENSTEKYRSRPFDILVQPRTRLGISSTSRADCEFPCKAWFSWRIDVKLRNYYFVGEVSFRENRVSVSLLWDTSWLWMVTKFECFQCFWMFWMLWMLWMLWILWMLWMFWMFSECFLNVFWMLFECFGYFECFWMFWISRWWSHWFNKGIKYHDTKAGRVETR